jgi:hypothetical protein
MGREVKRVALEFSWPLNKVWAGYINEHYKQCSACCGAGVTSARKRVEELVRLVLLSAEDTQRKHGIIPHPYFSEMGALHSTQGKVVSADIMPLAEGLSGRKLDGSPFGFDSVAAWKATNAVVAAAGLDEKWGYCPVCEGEGDDPATRAASEAWKATEPPTGDGWQMWENTSEGSPISPVFKTPEALARWLSDNGASTFGSSTADYDTWLNMIQSTGWAMDMVITDGRMQSGVEFVAEQK